MMTIRTRYSSPNPGHVHLDVDVPIGSCDVSVDETLTHAVIVVETPDDTGPAADAVRATGIEQDGNRIRVHVPAMPHTGTYAYTSIQPGGIVHQVAHAGPGGTVIQSAGDMVNVAVGRVTSTSSTQVYVEARLPQGSTLTARTGSGSVETTGPLIEANVATGNGAIKITDVGRAHLSTGNGPIEIAALRNDAHLETMNGPIRVTAVAACAVGATTTTGDIDVTGPVTLDAHTMTGRVRQRP